MTRNQLTTMSTRVTPDVKQKLRLYAQEHGFSSLAAFLRTLAVSIIDAPNPHESTPFRKTLTDTTRAISALTLLLDTLEAEELRRNSKEAESC